MRRLCLIFCLIGLSACGVTPVDPWDRQYLARPEMAWDPHAATSGYRSQVFFSKEASNGGTGSGGGGCGCN